MKPGWLTLFLKVLGLAGRAADDANKVFPHQGHMPDRVNRVAGGAKSASAVPSGNVVKLAERAKRRKVGKDVTRLGE
jgi:hypothetical protein